MQDNYSDLSKDLSVLIDATCPHILVFIYYGKFATLTR